MYQPIALSTMLYLEKLVKCFFTSSFFFNICISQLSSTPEPVPSEHFRYRGPLPKIVAYILIKQNVV
jgi:hypothetical protein